MGLRPPRAMESVLRRVPFGPVHRAKRAILTERLELFEALDPTARLRSLEDGERLVTIDVRGRSYELETRTFDRAAGGSGSSLRQIMLTVTDLPERCRPLGEGVVIDPSGNIVGQTVVMYARRSAR